MKKWFLTSAVLLASVSFAHADYRGDFRRFIDCANLAQKNADAKHCENYKKSLACNAKAIEAMQHHIDQQRREGENPRRYKHSLAERLSLLARSLSETKEAGDYIRQSQKADGCDGSSSATPPSVSSPSVFPASDIPARTARTWCYEDSTDDQTIEGCTAMIRSGSLKPGDLSKTYRTRKNAYAALWLDIVGQRNNLPGRLSEAISTIDMTAWPAAVIRMFLGQMPPAAVLAAADDPDAMTKRAQVCEAYFYSAELALRQGVKDEPARLFRLVVSDCAYLWVAAKAELKALGAAR